MLRINLLPGYVAQRRLTRKLIAYFAGGFVAVVVALLAFQFLYLQPELTKLTQEASDAVAAKADIDNLTTQATTIAAGVAPIKAKLDFVTSVEAYNQSYIKLYTTVARYTSPKILYTGMSVSGSTLTIAAYTPSIADLGRYLQIMYTEPDFKSFAVSTVPGGATAAEKLYYYKGVLIGVDGGKPTATTGTFPGVPAAVTFTPPAGAQIPKALGQSSVQGLPGGPGSPMPQGGPSYGGQGGFPGFPGGTAGGTTLTPWARIALEPDFNPKYFKVVVRHTDGFTFTATATLNNTFSPPAPPGGGGSVGVGGPGGYGANGGNGG